MKFDVQSKYRKSSQKYFQRDLELARKFAKIMYQEFGLRMMPGFILQLDNSTENLGSLSSEKLSETICEKIECKK